MAYFNHAFTKVMWGASPNPLAPTATGYLNAAGTLSVDLLPNNGVGTFTFADQSVAGWPSVAVAPTGGEPLTLISTALYQNDKVGPFHGGYQETNKSKMINPKFINEFYVVEAKAPLNHIIGVGATPNLDLSGGDAACCPTFYCNETYGIRFDIKGSAALRMLNHNAYNVTAAYTGCCDGPTPTVVDPAEVMGTWMNAIANNPIFSGVYGQYQNRLVNVGVTVTCDNGATWDLYLPDNSNAGIAGLYFEADGTTLTAAGTAFVNSIVAGLGGGAVATLNVGTLVAGTGYVTATGLTTTGGTGTGLTVDITAVAGNVTAVTINDPGLGYTAGDTITIVGGNGDATIDVATIGAFAFTSVQPYSAYASTGTTCCAGLVLESAFVETKFGDCTFQPTDFFEIEPLLIQASMVDETGDPCVFDQLCISDGITPSGPGSNTIYPAIQFGKQAMGTGEKILRELILSESYQQNHFATNCDLRIREITQGYDITSAVGRNALYTTYYIKHSVPRYNNPSGTFDNDQYLLKIPVDARDANFEAFMAAWLAGANNPVTLAVY